MIPVLTIANLERVTGVPRTTIHYYLRLGLLPRPQKTATSRSLYTDDHVKILEAIGELKRAGHSLVEIERELEHRVGQANESRVDLVAQEHERMHNRILAAATQEFAAKGYKSTHVTTIMKKLGITASVFYGHFPSKRRLIAECVSVMIDWSLAYGDPKRDSVEDPAERLMWLVFASFHVFELGSTALALVRVEKTQDDSELREPIEAAHAGVVQRIARDLVEGLPDGAKPPVVPDELVAHSLFGAYEQTVFRAYSDKKYSRRDLLRTHLWLFLAIQAARKGEIDIDSRLSRYDELLEYFTTHMPPLPPMLEIERSQLPS
ncbi:MAG: MerR family transcriptional regulator [bacterium]